jgi:hypothetical protein
MKTEPRPTLTRQDQVYWMGGSPCSGKSSASLILAERFGLALYVVDDSLPRLQSCFDPQRHPTLIHWTTTPWDELWMQPPGELLAQAIAAYTEHFSLILEDLAAFATRRPLLVEGTALLPGLVRPYLSDPHQAAWVIPNEAFQRQMYPQRGEWVQGILVKCHDPQAALHNWMDLDVAFGRWVLAETSRLGLPSLVVDGSRSIAENADILAEMLNLESGMKSSRVV